MLKKIFSIIFSIVSIGALSQNWDFTVTDANMTIQIGANVVTLDGQSPPPGALLGAFFLNNSGEYTCAGYEEWTGEQLAIAVWASEAGLDNGFSSGEEITWLMQVDNELYFATSSIMNANPPFSQTFFANGFGQILGLDFISAGCSDQEACNYCDVCLVFDNTLCQYPENLIYDCDNNCVNDTDLDGVCDEEEILGCTDLNADNYNPNATDDDGLCEYIIVGCLNEIASNFNPEATESDDSCIYCNDPNADNYYTGLDGSFCTDDIINNYNLELGSDGLFDCCFYANPGCTDDGSCFDIDGDGYLYECSDNFLYINNQGESVYFQSPFPGVAASNYNPNANVLIGFDYCYYFPACQDQNAINYGYNCNGDDVLSLAQSFGFSIDFNEVPNQSPVIINYNNIQLVLETSNTCCLYYGCTNPEADNYNQYANLDDDSCYFLGCTDGGATENGDGLIAYNYDASATLDDGTCQYYVCNDSSTPAMNYVDSNTVANNPSFSYCSDIDYYDNQTFMPGPDGLDDCCQYLGCLDPSSVNYNPDATIEELVFTASAQGSSVIFNPIPIVSSLGDTIGYENTCYPYIYGCLDPVAENYNDYDGDGNSNPLMVDIGETIYQLTDVNIAENSSFGINSLDIITEFNLSGNNTNVNTLPNVDINSVNPCEYIYGCTDPCYIEYYDVIDFPNEEAFTSPQINSVINNVGCDFYDAMIEATQYTFGCSQLLPLDPAPTFDDGSCTNPLLYGCMDPLSVNYNPLATVNDCLSCISEVLIDFNVDNPECYDITEGLVTWSVSGGVGAPYTYILSNDEGSVIESGQVTEKNLSTEFNLVADTYILEVFDSQSFTSSVSFSVIDSFDFIIDLWESGGWLNTIAGYDEYEWTLDGQVLDGPGFNSNQIYPNVPGLYSVTAYYQYSDGTCVSNTVYLDYELFQNSIVELDNIHITCVPNPLSEQAVIYIDNSHSIPLYCDLYDHYGKKVWSKSTLITETKSIIINNLAIGIYYFRVTNLDAVRFIPIIVLK